MTGMPKWVDQRSAIELREMTAGDVCKHQAGDTCLFGAY